MTTREKDQNLNLFELKYRFSEQIKRILFGFEDRIYELVNGYDFSGVVPAKDLVTDYKISLEHATAYQAVWNRNLRELFKEAKKTGYKFENFIDIGSGKGKACFYAHSKHMFDNIIGIDFSQPLLEIAIKNKGKIKSQNISFNNADASEYKLPQQNNFIFMFNPFDSVVLEKFITNNIEHFKKNNSLIAYANDIERLSLTKFGFETIFRNQSRKISLYRLA
jgi:Methyltransferase domain